MCDGAEAYWDSMMEQWGRQAKESTKYSDRRALLSPEEMFRWQLFRRNTKGKLLELPEGTHGYRFTGRTNDLSKLEWTELNPPGPVLILSTIPARKFGYGYWLDGYAFLVLSGESVYLVEV
jgi:hypothetical protein